MPRRAVTSSPGGRYPKLDKSFVRAIDSESRAAVVLNSLIEMSQRLRLAIVAEGTERPEQADDDLRAADVRLGQGWLFAVPLNARKLAPFLAEHAPA